MKCPKCKHEWIAFGRKPSVSDKQVQAAYKHTKGNVYQAARYLKVNVAAFQKRCWTLGLKATGHRKQNRFPEISNSQIEKAWLEMGGVVKGAAVLNMPPSVFYSRLRDTTAHRENPRRFSGQMSARKRTVAELAKVVAKCNGNYSEAALVLGVSRERIRQLVERDIVGGLTDSQK